MTLTKPKGAIHNSGQSIFRLSGVARFHSTRSPVHMIKLTQQREITPYVWVDPIPTWVPRVRRSPERLQ